MRRVLLFNLGLVLVACKKTPPAPPPADTNAAEAGAAAEPETPARCVPVSGEAPFVLGPNDTGRTIEAGSDETLPFAALVGDGVVWASGFAVGAIHEGDQSLSMSVVTLGPDGRSAKVIPLGTAHGDVEPPRLVAKGNMLVAGVLEPEASGRSLRLAKIEDGSVSWGATLHERSGESQAFDLALGDKKGIVVWDEDGPTNSVIQVATFDASTAASATAPRVISPATVDAESPRLVARPGGYWLAYVARSGDAEVDTDARYLAEEIGFRSIEVVALDANGSPTGASRSVTPKDGHVLVYDIAPAPEGGAVLVWRYDDAPSGAGGGEVMRALVRPGLIEPPSVVMEGDVGAGAPSLLNGWIAVMDSAETTRLAPIAPSGELTGPLAIEPEIGIGTPIAGGNDGMLVVKPAGRAVKLAVLKCSAPPPGK
jgi:hypothetical protein